MRCQRLLPRLAPIYLDQLVMQYDVLASEDDANIVFAPEPALRGPVFDAAATAKPGSLGVAEVRYQPPKGVRSPHPGPIAPAVLNP